MVVQCFSRSWLEKTRPACGSSGSTPTRKESLKDKSVDQSIAKSVWILISLNTGDCILSWWILRGGVGVRGTFSRSPQVTKFLSGWLIKCVVGFGDMLRLCQMTSCITLHGFCQQAIWEICPASIVLSGRIVPCFFVFWIVLFRLWLISHAGTWSYDPMWPTYFYHFMWIQRPLLVPKNFRGLRVTSTCYHPHFKGLYIFVIHL